MAESKPILKALAGTRVSPPPIWLMRQAGRYLPEYRATRQKAGDFLTLCYTPELAAEVSLQPVRRFEFDATILFADILLVPHALGSELCFSEGQGPRLSTIASMNDVINLRPPGIVRESLAPVFETLRILSNENPGNAALIGFAGAPWTVATYMISGKGTTDHRRPLEFMRSEIMVFDALIDRLTEATVEYLSAQIEAGAEVVKLFDSWAGSLRGDDFDRYVIRPIRNIISRVSEKNPSVPIIAYARRAGKAYSRFANSTGAACVALDSSVDPEWAALRVQAHSCVQGNLDPKLLVSGGANLVEQARKIVATFSNGPHIFNLGEGITPDADPRHVQILVDTVRDPDWRSRRA
ncbi:MAG: uroporphyrinogen decarboxylase [Albidovulum sp.]|nr:uroporphyrinogen decarboxylase [Albidovulum sp.]MDE0304284.1 uroporphyrinogen decarboxylase [Albidovulum sp.]MDE0531571.1 uroporphyrinogen decarboxylase [Albidovulum sp.]